MPDFRSLAIYVLLGACVLLGITAYTNSMLLDSTRKSLKQTKDALKEQGERIGRQKTEAAERLRTLNASVLAQQKRLDAAHEQQEKADATNSATIDGLRADLRRMRAAARGVLNAADDAGRRPGGGARQGEAAAGTDAGARDGAQAYRLVPATPDEEADDDAYEADRINNAYASCRADALKLRKEQ
ncbi:MAG: hypothetical protein JSS14_21835 [Proteobacteria bacterium]|nr:hypothetical protein [Pseudomonadota bacterium]